LSLSYSLALVSVYQFRELEYLELILCAHEMRTRKHAVDIQHDVEWSTDHVSNSKKQYISIRKKQSILQREDTVNARDRGFHDIMTEMDLVNLCDMDSCSLEKAAFDAVDSALCFLRCRTMKKEKRSRRRKQTSSPMDEVDGSLNSKESRSKAPWKLGMKPLREHGESDKKIRWKGKPRAVAIQHAI
jgi:hypothetical protein